MYLSLKLAKLNLAIARTNELLHPLYFEICRYKPLLSELQVIEIEKSSTHLENKFTFNYFFMQQSSLKLEILMGKSFHTTILQFGRDGTVIFF